MLSEERSERYRREKTKTHKRISPWFTNAIIKKIDRAKGKLSRAEWVLKVVEKALL